MFKNPAISRCQSLFPSVFSSEKKSSGNEVYQWLLLYLSAVSAHNEDNGSFCSLLTDYLCVHAILSKRIFDCRLNCNKSHLSDTKFSSVASSLKEYHSTTLHSFYLQTGISTVSWIQSWRFLGRRRLAIILWSFFVCGCLLEATIS